MNKQLRQVAIVAVVLLAGLVVATTYWQSWAGASLSNRKLNATELVAQLEVARGKILASNGAPLAWSVPHRKHGLTTYSRRYPPDGLFSQIVGYSTSGDNQVGLEQSLNDYLTGANTNLSNTLSQELDRLGGQTVHGDNVYLTVKPGAQKVAMDALAGRCGAVVALDAKTGAVLAMASSPTYNQNLISKPGGYTRVGKIKGTCGDASPLYNNATQGLYPPGSTFKLVTASAALDTGKFTPESRFYDPGYCTEYGTRVYNSSAPDSPGGHETFGNVTLAQGLENSINSVFCNVGKAIGAGLILDYAKRYGFYSQPPLDTPPNTINASGLYNKGRLWFPKNPDNGSVDPGRLAFGQERMLVTPLQMALVGATIADGGVQPKPYLVQKVVAPDGSNVSTTTPSVLGRVIKPQTAAELTQMMRLVVEGGTAASVGFPPALDVAGKTGTAELGPAYPNIYDSWFVSFAPASNPRYVVAVVVEKQLNGFGATVAAPIAKSVLETLLHK